MGSQVPGAGEGGCSCGAARGDGTAQHLPERPAKVWAGLGPSCPHVLQLSE